MQFTASIATLALVASVAAHGKIAVATGDAGGNGTALGIQGGVIPGPGKNAVTEPDTTVFKGANANGCGQTKGAGQNTMDAGTKQAMALSGSTLPQVTAGGSVSGTLHVVTSDGAGPYTGYVSPSGDGAGPWIPMVVMTQVPGDAKGNIKKSKRAEIWARALASVGIEKRATNINEDFPFKVAMPAGATCTGSMAGQSNVCLVKLVNPSKAGPFGGCIPVQMVAAGGAAAPAKTRRALNA